MSTGRVLCGVPEIEDSVHNAAADETRLRVKEILFPCHIEHESHRFEIPAINTLL